MKTNCRIVFFIVLVGLITQIGSANPGIVVDINPLNVEITSDITKITYMVTLSTPDDPGNKFKITFLDITSKPSDDWNYNFETDLTGTSITNSDTRSTKLDVIIPSGLSLNQNYAHDITVRAEWNLCDEFDNCILMTDENNIPLLVDDYKVFNTIIREGPAPIPEFPSVVLLQIRREFQKSRVVSGALLRLPHTHRQWSGS